MNATSDEGKPSTVQKMTGFELNRNLLRECEY